MPARSALLILLVLLGAGAAAAAPAPAIPPGGQVLLYGNINMGGQPLTIASDRPDFIAGIAAKSAAIQGGTWELCAQPNFKGVCVRTAASIRDLAASGLAKGVRSLRRVSGPQPKRGATGPSLKGMASEYFPAPRAAGARVPACPTGGAAAACVNQQAAQYCSALGYTHMRSVDIQIVKTEIYLADLLCATT